MQEMREEITVNVLEIPKPKGIVEMTEEYISSYVSFELPGMSLPIALWTIGTHCFQLFDSFAYLVITSNTKRSGKTRLSEIISFAASVPMNFSAMTPSTLFRVINPEPGKWYPEDKPFVPPTIIFDEAEALSSEAASTMRSVLNAGYRRGQIVPRTIGQKVIEYKVYCPKIFILIGDVYDTLRDRSIVITMKRAESPKRFLYDEAKAEGEALRVEIRKTLGRMAKENEDLPLGPLREITMNYRDFRAQFLTDRDEEIWLPLFALCRTFCPERLRELTRLAVDLCALKTADKRIHQNMDLFESNSELQEYAERAANDLAKAMEGHKQMPSAVAVERLRGMDLAPWRTYRGSGIDQHLLSTLLAKVGIPSVNLWEKRKVVRGYRFIDVAKAVKKI